MVIWSETLRQIEFLPKIQVVFLMSDKRFGTIYIFGYNKASA